MITDRKGIPLVVIAGPEELERGELSVKNLRVLAESDDRREYLNARLGQFTLQRDELVSELKAVLKEL